MGTRFRIVLYAENFATATMASSAAFRRIDELNRTFSDYDTNSELSRLSGSAGSGRWVPVSGDLWGVIRMAHELSNHSSGRFDITIGPMTRLWRWARRRGRLPDSVRIANARSVVGYEFVEFDEPTRRIRLAKAGMRLDVGGIGKGYAADQALAVLALHDIEHGLVDAGGDVVTSAAPPGTDGWLVTVPDESDGRLMNRIVAIHHTAVVTSGDQYRYLEVDGIRYSHLLDPGAGFGLPVRRIAVVSAPTGAEADAIATAISLMTATQGRTFLERYPQASGRVFELHESNWQAIHLDAALQTH